MKPIQSLIFFCFLILISCTKKQEIEPNNEPSKIEWKLQIEDEKLVGYSEDAYNKMKWYYWIKEQDTSYFKFQVAESKNDSLVFLALEVDKLTDFQTCLDSLNAIFPIIEKEFSLNKISSLFIGRTVDYPDLTKEITTNYEKEFGKKSISHKQINELLLRLPVTEKINVVLGKYNKKIKFYNIEKFDIIDLSIVQKYDEANDYSDYPDFSIDGFTSILIEEK